MHCQSEDLCTNTAKKLVQMSSRRDYLLWRFHSRRETRFTAAAVVYEWSLTQIFRVTGTFGANSSDQYLRRNKYIISA